jgi:hypothetical protein
LTVMTTTQFKVWADDSLSLTVPCANVPEPNRLGAPLMVSVAPFGVRISPGSTDVVRQV